MSLRAVLDTNVFISALLSPSGPPAALVRLAAVRRFVAVTSEPLLDELREALDYPKLARLHEMKAKTTAGIWKVNQTDLESVSVPLPSVAAQKRIVAKVDELIAILDKLEARLVAAQKLHGEFAAAAVHHLDV